MMHPIIPEEGETVMTLQTVINGETLVQQYKVSAMDMKSSHCFEIMKQELSRMLARLEHARTDANRVDGCRNDMDRTGHDPDAYS